MERRHSYLANAHPSTSTSSSLSRRQNRPRSRPPTRRPSSAPATAASWPTKRGAPASITREATSTSTSTAPTGAWPRREQWRPETASLPPPRPSRRPRCLFSLSKRSRRPGSRRSPRLPGGPRTSGRRASEEGSGSSSSGGCGGRRAEAGQSTLLCDLFYFLFFP